MRTNLLISLLLGTTLLACGDKDTGTTDPTDTGDTDDTDTDTDDTDDTGDTGEPAASSCTVLGTVPATVPIDSDVSLTVHLSCEDPDAAASLGWTYTLAGQELEAAATIEGDEVVLTVASLSTSGLLEGTEAASIASDNPTFVSVGGPGNNVLNLHRPYGDWSADLAPVYSQRLSEGGDGPVHVGDFDQDGELDIVAVSCDDKSCSLGLSLGDGGAFETWEWMSIGERTGAADELLQLWGSDSEVLVFFGADGGGAVIRAKVGGSGFGEVKTTDIATELTRYGFKADTVIDAIPVQGKADTSFAVLLSGATKGGSSCDDDDDFAIWDPDGSVSIFQGPVTCAQLAAGEGAMGLAGGPKSGDIADMDELVVWGGRVKEEAWDVFVWFDRDTPPSGDRATFSATLPGVGAEDFWLTYGGDLNDDGYGDLFLNATPADAAGYMAILAASSEKTWGTPSWLTLDGDTSGSGPLPVLRGVGSGMATGKRQHKPLTITKSLDAGSPVVALYFNARLGEGLPDQVLGVHFPDLDLKAERNAGEIFTVVGTAYSGGAVVVGGGSSAISPEDPASGAVGGGEVVFVGRGTLGGDAVLSRICTPGDIDEPGCDTVLAHLGGGSTISISGGDLILQDSSTLSISGGSSMGVPSALRLGGGGVRVHDDVTLLRSTVAPFGDLDMLEFVAVKDGEILGSALITHVGEDGATSAHFDWSGSAQGLTGAWGGTDRSLYWYKAASTEWLVGVSTGGGTVLTAIDLDDLIDAAKKGETLDIADLGTSVLVGEEVEAEPLPGPRAIGGWIDAPYAYVPDATAVTTVRDGPGLTADIIALVGSKGTGCPWRTVLIPGMYEDVEVAMGDMVTLSTSERSDCADLETPQLAADVLGSGGQQLYTAQWEDDALTLSFYFRQGGVIYKRQHKPMTITKAVDAPSPYYHLSAGNLNGDALQDLFLDGAIDALSGSGVLLSDGGGFETWDEPMEVPFAGYERWFRSFSATSSEANDVAGGMEMTPLVPGIQELRQE